MKSIRRHLRVVAFLFIGMFVALILYFAYAVNTYGGRWFTNPYNTRLQQQKSNVIPGRILDRNRNELAGVDDDGNRVYAKNKDMRLALSHVVGDNAGLTAGGIESFQARYLLGFDGNVFERVFDQFSGSKTRGSDVVLTIDAELTESIADAMGSYKGAVVVMNYRTGEILASVSQRGFDPNQIESYASGEDAALVNRATMGRYTPGSVYKIVTAAAALRYLPNADEKVWSCDGPMVFDAESRRYLPDVHFSQAEDQAYREQQQNAKPLPSPTPNPDMPDADVPVEGSALESGGSIGDYRLLRDYQSVYHGEISLRRAFAVSCNHTFAQIALEIGVDKLQKMSNEFAFDTDFLFPDLMLYASRFEKGDNEYDIGWSAIGQYRDIATPLHMCLIAASIGNDGVMMEPKLLRGVVNTRNYMTNTLNPKTYKKPLTVEEADKLAEYMRYCITDGTGKSAAVKSLAVCGKTGTAEVSSDKDVGNHAWFTGFIDDPDHPLAIAVLLEHAGSGGGKAAPVAGKALRKAVDLGY